MALDMTPEQKETGKTNFNRAVGQLAEADQRAQAQGLSRRRFMQGMIAAGATLPISAAAFFGYRGHGFPNTMRPVRAAIIGCGDEGGVLVGEHNPNFVHFIAACDIRPSNQKRIFEDEKLTNANSPRRGFKFHYGTDAKSRIRMYSDYRELLQNDEIEMVVIATPLLTHAQIAIDAMNAGKHVLCEKLMAWNIAQCKAMIRTAREKGVFLSIGHQRHYSMLYAHANEIINEKLLGDIKHIRALWHRNNVRLRLNSQDQRQEDPEVPGEPLYRDSWRPQISGDDRNLPLDVIRRAGFKDLNELVRWRLYTPTGGGLMAELGSHQLDACSIFLGKRHPLAVSASGGINFYKDDRDAEDHVYCIYEFPGERFNARAADPRKNDIVTVTYSSINTNDFENYGECVMGTKGTLVVEKEESAMLWGAQPTATTGLRSTEVTTNTAGSQPVLDASATSGPSERRGAATGQASVGLGIPSRGYREEMEHLAYLIRMQGQGMASDEGELKPRCGGREAMADAIVALTANKAMKDRTRIEFRPEWFDPDSSAVPDAAAARAIPYVG